MLAAPVANTRAAGGDEGGAGQLLQARGAADMVMMFVAVEEVFDVAQLEAEAADVGGDEIGAALGAAVDQDMPVAAGDEDGGDAAGADEVGVGVEADRRGGFIPVVPVLAGRGPQRAGLFDRRLGALDLARGLAEGDGDLLRGEQEREANEHRRRR